MTRLWDWLRGVRRAGSYRFNVAFICDHPVGDDAVTATIDAIACTLDRHGVVMRKPLPVLFCNDIISPNPDSKIVFNAMYERTPKERIVFAMDEIGNLLPEVSLSERLTLIAAHEATHLAQCHRGEDLTGSPFNPNYVNCPHEDEAWREAVKTYGQLVPRPGYSSFHANGRTYFIQPPA